ATTNPSSAARDRQQALKLRLTAYETTSAAESELALQVLLFLLTRVRAGRAVAKAPTGGRPPWVPGPYRAPGGGFLPSRLQAVPNRTRTVRFQGPTGPIREVRGLHSLEHLSEADLLQMVRRGTAPRVGGE